eukprot:TRINITY_DN46_c1_g1_i1.p2 TRINITY_DN46_c1_g1~~TRINITY_DN46_c1_g1_i1.p2  ORF type:complete len:193 (-),score=39.56 TRINITY_DN46_c1_g1_i1:4-582(-)
MGVASAAATAAGNNTTTVITLRSAPVPLPALLLRIGLVAAPFFLFALAYVVDDVPGSLPSPKHTLPFLTLLHAQARRARAARRRVGVWEFTVELACFVPLRISRWWEYRNRRSELVSLPPDFQRGLCVVCQTEPRAVCYQPCGHLVACLSCDAELRRLAYAKGGKLRCPICRQISKSSLVMQAPINKPTCFI